MGRFSLCFLIGFPQSWLDHSISLQLKAFLRGWNFSLDLGQNPRRFGSRLMKFLQGQMFLEAVGAAIGNATCLTFEFSTKLQMRVQGRFT